MDFELVKARQPDFQHKKDNQEYKEFYVPQSHFRPVYAAR